MIFAPPFNFSMNIFLVNESDMDINRPLDDTNTSGEHPLNNNDNSDTTQNLNGNKTSSLMFKNFNEYFCTLRSYIEKR